MVLTGNEIYREFQNNNIKIAPFDQESLNPNSYDLRLGNTILKYTSEVLDIQGDNDFEEIVLPEEGYILEKDTFYLGFSEETIGSNLYVPLLHNKSGIARMGLFTHITSDLLSLGYEGKVCIQLFPTLNIKVFPGMKIGQLSFWKVEGKIK